jgi:hypothetical protein
MAALFPCGGLRGQRRGTQPGQVSVGARCVAGRLQTAKREEGRTDDPADWPWNIG